MAKGTSKTAENTGKQQKGKLMTILTVVLIAVFIIAVFGGIFYFIIFNNIGGVTERHYSAIKKIPVLNLALPEPPDPLNPKYMTNNEIRKQYVEFRKENEMLREQLAEAQKKIDEYKVFKDNNDELTRQADEKTQDLAAREAAVVEKEQKLKELQEKIDTLIANGDPAAYAEYYESIEPDNAKQIYEKILLEQQIDANVKKFAQVYAEMDPAAAAAIFEKLGTSQIGMIAETLMAMNKADSAEILESMTPDFAAKVTEKLDALYRGN